MKVLHEEYLRAFLDGVAIQRRNEISNFSNGWEDFVAEDMSLESFNNSHFVFRYKPKIIEVNQADFYAEYDSGVPMCEIIEKYLPRGGSKRSKNNK